MDDCWQEAKTTAGCEPKRREPISVARRNQLVNISQDIANILISKNVVGRELCIVRTIVECMADERNTL